MAKKILYVATAHSEYWRVKSFSSLIKKNYPGSTVIVSEFDSYLLRFLEVFFRSLPHILFQNRYDLLFLGFLSQPLFPFYRVFWRGKIFSDFLISLFDTSVVDRKKISSGSLYARLLIWLDKTSIMYSDLLIVDTPQLKQYFKKLIGVNGVFEPIYLGANVDRFKKQKFPSKYTSIVITFHGSFIPLHGVDVIIKAAKILEKSDADFSMNIIGEGQTYADSKRLADSLSPKSLIMHGRLSQEEMNRIYSKTHIGLGIFGSSSKVDNILTNKVFELLAMNKAVVTASTPSTRSFFKNGENAILVKKNNPVELAKKLLSALNDYRNLMNIADNGHRLFVKRGSEKYLSSRLTELIG